MYSNVRRSFHFAWLVGLLVLAAGCAHRSTSDALGRGNVLGDAPSFGPGSVSDFPNGAAADIRIWVPGLDEGYDPQGLAVVEDNLLISSYRSTSLREHRGPCRIFRVNMLSAKQTGFFDIPKPCGHAGGLAYDGNGLLYVADTNTLFEVELKGAFGPFPPVIRKFPLAPGLTGALATSGPGYIMLGTYEQAREGKLFRFPLCALRALKDGQILTSDMTSTTSPIPPYAQGAAEDPDGARLWISRSDIGWGYLDLFEIPSGNIITHYSMPAGIEAIAFDHEGGLWAVSEAGAKHLYDFPFAGLLFPFNPLILKFNTSRLK